MTRPAREFLEDDEVRLEKWFVKIGDRVEADQLIAHLGTDKATFEVTAWKSGTVSALHVSEGEVFKVSRTEPIASID